MTQAKSAREEDRDARMKDQRSNKDKDVAVRLRPSEVRRQSNIKDLLNPVHNHQLEDVHGEEASLVVGPTKKARPKARPSAGTNLAIRYQLQHSSNSRVCADEFRLPQFGQRPLSDGAATHLRRHKLDHTIELRG